MFGNHYGLKLPVWLATGTGQRREAMRGTYTIIMSQRHQEKVVDLLKYKQCQSLLNLFYYILVCMLSLDFSICLLTILE